MPALAAVRALAISRVEREPFSMSSDESHRSKALLITGRYSFRASATAALRGPDQLTKIFIFSMMSKL